MYIKRLPIGDVEANCYIICDEETKVGAVIDVGGFSDVLLKEIEEAQIKNLKYILCTHGHFDHIAGVKKLKDIYTEAKIVIGEKDAILTEDSEKNVANYFGAVFESFKPDITVKENDILKIGNVSFRVLETPGHSLGGVCYICDDEKFLFSGDTLFKGSIGNFAPEAAPEMQASLAKVWALPDALTVYPGHNDSTFMATEKRTNPFVNINWEMI